MIAGIRPATVGALVFLSIMWLLVGVVFVRRELRARRRGGQVPSDAVRSPAAAADPPLKGDVWRAWMEEHWQGKDPQRRV